MKIFVTMKTPDAMEEAVKQAVLEEMNFESADEMGDEDREVYDNAVEAQQELLKKWFRYSEYVDLQFDTETMEVTVLEAN